MSEPTAFPKRRLYMRVLSVAAIVAVPLFLAAETAFPMAMRFVFMAGCGLAAFVALPLAWLGFREGNQGDLLLGLAGALPLAFWIYRLL